jgi:hypothetical protein
MCTLVAMSMFTNILAPPDCRKLQNKNLANFTDCIANNRCDPEGNLDATGLALFAQGGAVLKVASLHGRQALRGWVRQLRASSSPGGSTPGR